MMRRTLLPSSSGCSAAHCRRGFVRGSTAAMLASLVLLGVLAAQLIPDRDQGSRTPLVVYCAASNKGVMEAIRHDYRRDHQIELQVQYGASQSLLAGLEVARVGDLYLPADDSYLHLARQRNLLAGEYPLARMGAVVAVPKGNPRQIARLTDLFSDDLRIAQAAYEVAAIGKLTRDALLKNGHWDALDAHTTAYKTTVNDVANDVKVGAVDAGIVFDVVLHDYDTLEGVAVPELADIEARVAIAVLKSSRQPEQAAHFARYVAARDKGQRRYREFGFQPVDGDARPEARPASHE